MKKSSYIILVTICTTLQSNAQNVGLGTPTATRAKFESHGLVGNTAAIFGGDGNGIGIVGSWPTIGFNGYYNNGNRFIHDGYMLMQYLDLNSGQIGFDVHGSGLRNAFISGTASYRALTMLNNGRVIVGPTGTGGNATLNVGRYPGLNSTVYLERISEFTAFNHTAAEHTYIYGSGNNASVYFNNGVPDSKIVIGNGGGCVGINWPTPTHPLEIHFPDFHYCLGFSASTNLNRWFFGTGFNFLRLFFDENLMTNLVWLGQFQFDGTYTNGSDIRIKENIEELAPMLSKLLQLRPSSYSMLHQNPNSDRSIGFIAQELKQVFPELVHVTAGEPAGYKDIPELHLVNYSGMAPIVVQSLKEQQTMLNNLKLRAERLVSQLDSKRKAGGEK